MERDAAARGLGAPAQRADDDVDAGAREVAAGP